MDFFIDFFYRYLSIKVESILCAFVLYQESEGSKMDLSKFGAPGFQLRTDLDFSGHESGNVAPHVNTRLINPAGDVMIGRDRMFQDLTHNQLPGFNGMQNGFNFKPK